MEFFSGSKSYLSQYWFRMEYKKHGNTGIKDKIYDYFKYKEVKHAKDTFNLGRVIFD